MILSVFLGLQSSVSLLISLSFPPSLLSVIEPLATTTSCSHVPVCLSYYFFFLSCAFLWFNYQISSLATAAVSNILHCNLKGTSSTWQLCTSQPVSRADSSDLPHVLSASLQWLFNFPWKVENYFHVWLGAARHAVKSLLIQALRGEMRRG